LGLFVSKGAEVVGGETPGYIQHELRLGGITGECCEVIRVAENATPHGTDAAPGAVGAGLEDIAEFLLLHLDEEKVDEDDEEEGGEEAALLDAILDGVWLREGAPDLHLALVVVVKALHQVPHGAGDAAVVQGLEKGAASDTRESLLEVKEDDQGVRSLEVQEFRERPGVRDGVSLFAETVLGLAEWAFVPDKPGDPLVHDPFEDLP
jgi:hypothetical protein